MSDIKLIEDKDNIETYEANMKVLIKKIKTENEEDSLSYKEKLKSLKEKMNIYDIIIDESNNCCFSYDLSEKENINEFIYNNIIEKKELLLEGHTLLSKEDIFNLFKKEDAMCRIEINKVQNNEPTVVKGSGFFMKIKDKDIPFEYCLITNNHIINEEDIQSEKEITLKNKYINNLRLSNKRKIITNKKLDYTCIQILKEDGIKNFFNIDPNINNQNGLQIFENKDIYILQFPLGKGLSFSNGKVLSVSKNIIRHNCSTQEGSSGSPIISSNSNESIIGLHRGGFKDGANLSSSIISILKNIKEELKNNKSINTGNKDNKSKNFIRAEFNIKNKSKIRVINSFEENKRTNNIYYDKPSDYNNEKEIMQYCEISINKKKIDFSYFYEFDNIGKNEIIYSFSKNLTKTDFLFCDCNSLSKIDLSNFNTENVNNMRSMFEGCSLLSSINLSNFHTENVNNMCNMFKSCNSLSIIDLSNINTQNVNDMRGMFEGCSSLSNIDLQNFKTEKVTDMSDMFKYCNSLLDLDISYFNTKNLKNMRGIFKYCNSLTNLNLSYLDTKNVNNMRGMFEGCSSLSELNLFYFSTINVNDMSYMFKCCEKLSKINNLSKFNTKNVVNMCNMFDKCSSLSSIDLSYFNTQNVTNMKSMFEGCKSLKNIDLSKFNTENVTNMNCMFFGCSSLSYLNLETEIFKTENVTNMSDMFNGCTSLTSLNLSKFNTNNVTDMSNMFEKCTSLSNLDLSNFYTPNVKDMTRMFDGCSSLSKLNLYNFNTQNIDNINCMFKDCINLKKENLKTTDKKILKEFDKSCIIF